VLRFDRRVAAIQHLVAMPSEPCGQAGNQPRVPMSGLALSSNLASEFEWQDVCVEVQQTIAATAQLLIEYPPIAGRLVQSKK
jgi:hypothetical protein